MSEPTNEEMKAALREAGAKIKTTATDEEVWLAYEELKASQPAEPATATVEPVEVAISAPVATPGKETLDDVLRRANPQMGDKDPMVLEWCKANLSAEDFDARYQGRKFDRA